MGAPGSDSDERLGRAPRTSDSDERLKRAIRTGANAGDREGRASHVTRRVDRGSDALGGETPGGQSRREIERREIESVSRCHARRYAVAPLLEQEPIGVERLLGLIRQPLFQP